MNKIYNLMEIANTHGGSKGYVFSLLKQFESFKSGFGIKFQPFKCDEIALKDYSWFPVYKELFFDPDSWKQIITKASETKDVWLDMFDVYSVQILRENLPNITGIKLQASVVNNFNLLTALSKVDLSDKIAIINIASFAVDEINEVIKQCGQYLKAKEVILQVGFQDYPTEISDSGLGKIKVLSENFSHRISFADHVDGNDEYALHLPVMAAVLGASIIEKHIMHSTLETKYDHYSSLTFEKYSKYLSVQNNYQQILLAPFVSEKERKYLLKSVQKPVLNKPKNKGMLVDLKKDLDFKRTDMPGLDIYSLNQPANQRFILANAKEGNRTLMKSDFKKAKIATIIACRMKSSRLPKKATLKIGEIASVELCIKNALKFKGINHTVLATSYLEEDSVLKDYTYHKDVIFHTGHPEDVINRYLGIINELDIDVFVRVTADMPYICNDILQVLLESHFRNGADYTAARKAAIGTNLEIINAEALRRVSEYFPSANYSEYMTYYFQNNPSHFNLNYVDLPDDLIRDYRLTLDYEDDLKLFRIIEEYFSGQEEQYKITDIFEYLDQNPQLADINNNCIVKYHTDKDLIARIKANTTISK
ncbi:MAG: N-acetylneuraminate synthase family protein [Candidatus Margulisiibacteriota bacterium]|nr:N-acetylneuraminate synthase family protein [Candidatus Margulisiibacteriota bacterium]